MSGGCFLRGLVILALTLTVLVFMLPVVVGFLAFVILAVGIFMLLARMGLLPGFVFKTYTFQRQGDARDGARRRRNGEQGQNAGRAGYGRDADYRSPGEKSWYEDDQDGEIITLPETALKKDGEK
jgi:hypothetical protein